MRTTHTYVILDLSSSAYQEIKQQLTEAGYQQAFHETADYGTVIDMHGLAVAEVNRAHRISQRLLPAGNEADAVVRIPHDTAGGNITQRTERAVRWLWSRGIYPGPSAVSLRLHGHVNRDLNGRETRIRNRMMRELNISRQRRRGIRHNLGREDVLGSWADR